MNGLVPTLADLADREIEKLRRRWGFRLTGRRGSTYQVTTRTGHRLVLHPRHPRLPDGRREDKTRVEFTLRLSAFWTVLDPETHLTGDPNISPALRKRRNA
jgi:hypothetical protein